MSDEHFYTEAISSHDSLERDNDLYNKALALTFGDVEKAKYTYINLWVERRKKYDQAFNAPEIMNNASATKDEVEVVKVRKILEDSHNLSYEGVVKGISVFDEIRKLYGKNYIDLVARAIHGGSKDQSKNLLNVSDRKFNLIRERFENHLNINGVTYGGSVAVRDSLLSTANLVKSSCSDPEEKLKEVRGSDFSLLKYLIITFCISVIISLIFVGFRSY